MKIHVAVGMLAALLLVLLAPSMTKGLVLTRCEMEQHLNQTVPANTSSNLSGNTSDAAHIVCYAELVSGLNTSKVSQSPNAPDNSAEDHHPKHDDSSETSGEFKPHKGRKQRSLWPKPAPKPNPKPKPDDGGKPSKPNDHSVTHPPNPHSEPPKHHPTGAPHHNSSKPSAEPKTDKPRRQRSLGPKPGPNPKPKPDNGGKPSKPDDHSVTHPPNPHSEPPKHHPTGAPHNNSSKPSAEPKTDKPRRQRSLGPKPGPNPKPKPDNGGKPSKPDDHSVTHPPNPHSEPPKHHPTGAPHNNSSNPSAEPKPHKGRSQRSIKWPKPEPKPQPKPEPKPQPKPEPKPQPKPQPKPDKGGKHDESSETFYGVFQLSDRVACASGNKTTLNLCGLTCDKLIDDDITDDIACLRTLISKFTPVDSLKGEAKEHIKKLYGQLYQKQCASVADAQFFFGC